MSVPSDNVDGYKVNILYYCYFLHVQAYVSL